MKTSEKITRNGNNITIVQTYEVSFKDKKKRIPRKQKKLIKSIEKWFNAPEFVKYRRDRFRFILMYGRAPLPGEI